MPRYMMSLLFDLETAFIMSDRLLSPMRNNKRWHQESHFTTTTDSSGACTDGMVDAIKAHTVHTDHFNAHHGGGMDIINFCIEIQDVDYEGDGSLTDGSTADDGDEPPADDGYEPPSDGAGPSTIPPTNSACSLR